MHILDNLDIVPSLKAIWDYGFLKVDGNEITFGKCTVALFLLILGFVASRFLSNRVSASVSKRLKLPSGSLAAIHSVTYYILLLFFGLLALKTANVPLTVFTLLGGAAAIGLGFGSQNIVNNFISGLILLIERPITVGDFIEVEGVLGTVESIGARSTRINSVDHTRLIVPNSTFLEKKVLNWTLSDNTVRGSVTVGVAYGSPCRKVSEFLLKAIEEHPSILKNREPLVLLTDFGENAIQFQALFWLGIRNLLDRRIVESDIRFRIEELFREANISICYPQRDLHLDSIRPLEVRVLNDLIP
jgi:potassium efflux system protein